MTRNTQLIVVMVLLLAGCALLFGGFITPPQGKIDSSVLVAFGEILTFCGAVLGIDYHYRFNK